MFEQLDMLWMGIWVRTYAVLHVLVGVDLRENGVWPSLYDVAVSWLRLHVLSVLAASDPLLDFR